MTTDVRTNTKIRPTSQRERAKEERRTRIINAVCNLLRSVGLEDMSMKAVADEASVSLSTVYNLFTSKSDVIAHVFREDYQRFSNRISKADANDALDRIFVSVDVAADQYAADPDFYRAILGQHANTGKDASLDVALRDIRMSFWRGLIDAAINEGLIRDHTHSAVLATLLVQTGIGVNADWISGAITTEELKQECKFGFAAAILPFATEESEAILRKIIETHHTKLSKNFVD